MATSVHSKEEAMELIRQISNQQWAEGIVIMNPHRERMVRKERGKRLNYQVWPESLADRAINSVTHLRKKFGSEIGLEVACRRLETPNPEEEEML